MESSDVGICDSSLVDGRGAKTVSQINSFIRFAGTKFSIFLYVSDSETYLFIFGQESKSRQPGRPKGSRDTHPRLRRSDKTCDSDGKNPSAGIVSNKTVDIGNRSELKQQESLNNNMLGIPIQKPSISVDLEPFEILYNYGKSMPGRPEAMFGKFDPFHGDWPHWN